MFLKQLIIENIHGEIRNISFKKGLNLIVDEAYENQSQQSSGNSVGKTTLLRFIDYCFGAKADNIYKDTEFVKLATAKIQDYLKETEVLVTIILVEDLDDNNSEKITIQRNFLTHGNKIQKINDENFLKNESFDLELKKLLFKTEVSKPTLRQIVAKNIRVDKNRMNNIVRVLGDFGKKEDYEALYLFWLNIPIDSAEEKRKNRDERDREFNFRKRLKIEGELPLVEQKLAFHLNKIKELEEQKNNFNLNENYAKDIEEINQVKFNLNRISTSISRLEVRRDLILESKDNLTHEYSKINTDQIKLLYDKAKALIPNIQVTFEETITFHNDLIEKKLNFITKELPDIEQNLKSLHTEINELSLKELALTNRLHKYGIFEDIEVIIAELSKQYERKGNLEEQKRLWEESNERLNKINQRLVHINEEIASKDELINRRVSQFNNYFSKISEKLYNENYILAPSLKDTDYDLIVTNVDGNPGTGKKKAQIAAFDFAYLQFADELQISCLHFILHDQLESIHSHQLTTLIDVANSLRGQYIMAILRDKLPNDVNVHEYVVLSLSQEDKLLKID